MFGYSAYRIFEESLRIDSSVHIFGLRLNTYIASLLAVIGAIWFYRTQHRPARTLTAVGPSSVSSPASASASSPSPASASSPSSSLAPGPGPGPGPASAPDPDSVPGDHARDPEDAAPGPSAT